MLNNSAKKPIKIIKINNRKKILYLLGRIDLSQVVTSSHPLHDANAAFTEAEAGKSLKVLIEP